MRPLEILLLSSTFLVVFQMFFINFLRLIWALFLPILAVFAAAVQFQFEGPRWQIVPAYLTICLFFVIWLPLERVAPHSVTRVSFGYRLAKIIIGLSGGLASVVALALALLVPVFHFEKPTGNYEIGTMNYHWIDASRTEVFSINPKTRRELMVQISYPSKLDATLPPAAYVENADALSAAQGKLHGWPSFILGHLKYVKSNARPLAAFAKDRPAFPVLLFMEGITGYRQMNTFQIEELVSRGYVVVAIDQPFVAATVVFPDGREIAGLSKIEMDPLIQQSIAPVEPATILNGNVLGDGIIPYFAQDVVFVLDQLEQLNNSDETGIVTGRLDLKRIGIFGVSFGGITTGEACRVDRRLRACLVLDAPMTAKVAREGMRQPGMWITRDAQNMRNEGWSQFDIDQHQKTMRTVFAGLSSDGYFVQVADMFHVNLTDVPYFSPLLTWFNITGPIDAKRAHDIVNAYTVAFFDKYLGGPETSFLDGPSAKYPEVQLEVK